MPVVARSEWVGRARPHLFAAISGDLAKWLQDAGRGRRLLHQQKAS